jgi:hypothetical protein
MIVWLAKLGRPVASGGRREIRVKRADLLAMLHPAEVQKVYCGGGPWAEDQVFGKD